jgi:hypothetical protein
VGPVSICSVPCSPPPGRHWTSPCVGPTARRRRSRDAGQAAAPGYGRPSCEPGTANAAPSLPDRPDAGRRPRRPRTTTGHVDRLRPTVSTTARHTEALQVQAARTARRQCRGHRRPVRPDTWTHRTRGHRTRGHRTLDVRSTGWTDVPTTGPGTRTRQRPAWPASGHPRYRRPPAGRPDLAPGSRRLGTLGHPQRPCGDGTCAAALTATATGRLPSTAQHEAAPRRTALLKRESPGVRRRVGG